MVRLLIPGMAFIRSTECCEHTREVSRKGGSSTFTCTAVLSR